MSMLSFLIDPLLTDLFTILRMDVGFIQYSDC